MRRDVAGAAATLVACLAAAPAPALTCSLSATGASFGTAPVGAIKGASTSGALALACPAGQAYAGVVQICLTGVPAGGTLASGAGGSTLPFTLANGATGTPPTAGACALSTSTPYVAGRGLRVSFPLSARIPGAPAGLAPALYRQGLAVHATAATSGGAPLWQGATSFPISLQLAPSCAVANAALAFGSVAAGRPARASAQMAVDCTLSTPFRLTLDAGRGAGASLSERYLTGPGGRLGYRLFQDYALTLPWGAEGYSGVGAGSAQSVPVYGQIDPQPPYPTGDFTDTVIVTVSY